MGIRPGSRMSMSRDSTYHSLYGADDDAKTIVVLEDSQEQTKQKQSDPEQPKIALRRHFSALHPFVHLLPLAATIFVVQLSLRRVYWDDDGGYDPRWQTFLQFPAKLHEILIVGSLSAIVLHIFRRMLVGIHGIPLGLMVGAYQIGSAEYLISKSFVKPLRHSLFHRHYKTFLVSLSLGLAIIYSFLVGPASAAAIIPILDWWDVTNPFNDSLPLTCYLGRLSSTEIYPETLRADDIIPDCLNILGYQGCPREGFNELDTWISNWADEGQRYNLTENRYFNPTLLSSFSGRARRELVAKLAYSKDSSSPAATAATLHSSILALTDAFWHYVESGNIGMMPYIQRPKFIISEDTRTKSPLVQVQCTAVDYAELMYQQRGNHSSIVFDTSAMNNFSGSDSDGYVKNQWKLPKEVWDFPKPFNTMDRINVTWIDALKVENARKEKLQSSLAVVLTLPEIFYTNFPNGTSLAGQGSVVTSCIIDARWAQTDVTFDPSAETIVRPSLVDWIDEKDTNLADNDARVVDARSKWKLSEAIAINSTWATALDSGVLENSVPYYNWTMAARLLRRFIYTMQNEKNESLSYFRASNDIYDGKLYTESVSENVAIVLSAMMADWISRSTLRDTSFTTLTSAEENGNVSTIDLLYQLYSPTSNPFSTFDNQTAIEFQIQRYGWGYGLNSGTIWFSIIILLTHALLVVLYFGYSFIFWVRDEGWTSAAWGSIGELVALANLSPPATELNNSGAGINRSQTWMARLRIREHLPGQIELVIGKRGGTVIPNENLLKIGREYS